MEECNADQSENSDETRIGEYVRQTYCLYWKEIFEFNGMKFFVTNQWYERHREHFTR